MPATMFAPAVELCSEPFEPDLPPPFGRPGDAAAAIEVGDDDPPDAARSLRDRAVALAKAEDRRRGEREYFERRVALTELTERFRDLLAGRLGAECRPTVVEDFECRPKAAALHHADELLQTEAGGLTFRFVRYDGDFDAVAVRVESCGKCLGAVFEPLAGWESPPEPGDDARAESLLQLGRALLAAARRGRLCRPCEGFSPALTAAPRRLRKAEPAPPSAAERLAAAVRDLVSGAAG